MGLFKSKQTNKKSPADDASDEIKNLFDERYREELRNSGRAYFEKVIQDNAALFKQDLDATIVQVNADLKDYMTKRLDGTLDFVNDELTKQLDERLKEYDKVTKNAQEQTVQALDRNAKALEDKYQQLSQTLEQSIATQEALMITVFEENKARIMAIQQTQDGALKSLQDGAKTSQQQTEQLSKTLQQVVSEQAAMMTNVFKENKTRLDATKQTQEAALLSLTESAKALQQQQQQLSATLQQTVVSQEETMLAAFEENMAQIIEHYLLGALGDQFDLKAQLPIILKQMEANKQAIADDMKL